MFLPDVGEIEVVANRFLFVCTFGGYAPPKDHGSGKTTTKADLLAFMRSTDYTPKSEIFDDIHSKQFGDT